MKQILDIGKYKNVNGVEYDLGKRWEKGIPHHPNSEKMFEKIMNVDWLFNGDQFCWKYGGDGDNGESLMYLLDVIFDEQDVDKKGDN